MKEKILVLGLHQGPTVKGNESGWPDTSRKTNILNSLVLEHGQAEVKVHGGGESRDPSVGSLSPSRASLSFLSLSCPPRIPSPQLTVKGQHFAEFLYVPGDTASIIPKYILQLVPLLVAECALGPGLHKADGVRGVAPTVRLQLPQDCQGVCARPAAINEGRDLEAAEEEAPSQDWRQ